MDNKVEQLYSLILKDQYRVTKTTREIRYNLTIIHIYLEATKPIAREPFSGAVPFHHITFTTYHL